MLYVWFDLGFYLKYREMFKFLKNIKKKLKLDIKWLCDIFVF